MREQRRRRNEAKSQKEHSPQEGDKESAREQQQKSRSRSSKSKKKEAIEDDEDPYDSDPGESYRRHCMSARTGSISRSCLGVPNILVRKQSMRKKDFPSEAEEEEETVLTSPPSPLTSEMGDPYGPLPPSLPHNPVFVRYSLRSSVTDGSEPQPNGPSVMERRELRPNSVHLNVSHWSDWGGRAYMEDRYDVMVSNTKPFC